MVLTKEQAEGELDEVYGQYAQFEDKNLKIFVINLKPALRRRRFMELQLDNPGLPQWQIVEAVDGRLLNTAEMNDYTHHE